MTLPTSGPISIQQINSEFSLGNNLNAYKGVRWFKADNSRGFFPSGANAFISMSEFRGTRKTSPVVSGSATYGAGTTSITLPSMFNTLTVDVRAGGGGGGGGGYLKSYGEPYSGSPGGSGGNSRFGNQGDVFYVTASAGGGGGGGSSSAAGVFSGVPLLTDGTGATGSQGDNGGGGGGGSGGAAIGSFFASGSWGSNTQTGAPGGPGGAGGRSTQTVLNIDQIGFDAIKQYYGISVSVSIGGGGAGGLGGNQGGTFAGSGSNGGAGYIVISWT
jgi:hypothetical protein